MELQPGVVSSGVPIPWALSAKGFLLTSASKDPEKFARRSATPDDERENLLKLSARSRSAAPYWRKIASAAIPSATLGGGGEGDPNNT